MLSSFPLALGFLVPALSQASPQEEGSKSAPPSQEASADSNAPPASLADVLRDRVGAKDGPVLGAVGSNAEVQVPEGLLYADGKGARSLLTLYGNIPGGSELAAVIDPAEQGNWFVIFTFQDVGHVSDEEKDDLDADELLDSMKEGLEEENEHRKERHLETLEIVGWERPPFYDPRTHNLTWATRIRDSHGGESVNWEVRLLGRKGVMSAQLVIDPDRLKSELPRFDALIDGFAYKDGHRYAQYVQGDKVAEYGLGALVVGGAGVAAAKLGLFGKLWKLVVAGWKLVLVGFVAAGAFLKNLWARVTGKKRAPRQDPASGTPAGGA